MKKNNSPVIRWVLVIALFFSLMLALGFLSFHYITPLSKPEIQQKLKTEVTSFGFGGWLLVLCIQIIQIVIAFIPGEPVEILAGALYGWAGGLFLCLLGCVMASSGIFILSKRFGAPFAANLIKTGRLDKFTFLKDTKKLETIVLILFLIPGTPKDLLTYVVGTSSMKLIPFLVISTLARLPSILSSTILGSAMRQGQWIMSVSVFAFTAVLGIIGIKYQDGMIGFCKRIGQRINGMQ
ncbi:VTT domain-containing protein [Lacrimispora sp.]|uniref:TVP38/TMEM64 family protein n=1 Tax=Lacrimispora sp. TaxID=2719234 RepID=UPI0032E4370C